MGRNMALLSDRESFDRQAGKRAQCGIDSATARNGSGFTIEEVCARADYPMPTTEEDLRQFAALCETWDIKTNIDDVGYFKAMRQDVTKGYPCDTQ